jgi:hypothetical protein
MNIFNKIFLFVLFVIYSAFSIAQNSCSDRLILAKQLFESGQIEQIPILLDSCLIKGYGKDYENQAYRLLMQTYLFDYNRDKAKEVMLRFLKKNPEYRFTSSDPIEIKEIYDLYKVIPNWGFGLYAGTNFTQVYSSQIYSVFNLNSLNSTYTQKFGYNAGLFFEKYFGFHSALSFGFNMKMVSYQNSENIANNLTSVTFKENSLWLSSPVTFSYVFGTGRFSPFIYCGLELNYLLKARGNYKYRIAQENNGFVSQTGNATITSFRNLFDCSAIGGIGFNYKVSNGFLKLWIGYNYTLSDYVANNKRYENVDRIMNYGHIDDDIKLNQFTSSLTYTRILYKIKSKENYAANQ